MPDTPEHDNRRPEAIIARMHLNAAAEHVLIAGRHLRDTEGKVIRANLDYSVAPAVTLKMLCELTGLSIRVID